MSNRLLKGFWKLMIPIPGPLWKSRIAAARKMIQANLAFMSEDHHAVRNFVVRELPTHGKPLPPTLIAERLDLDISRVKSILQELEEHMTFLFRNDDGHVAWAYPVTADETPHRLTFSSGETLYAA
ncbi:MAG: hypothetical protein JRG91_21340 [Deltaproteobacteria bacterium]|nr:hypothetical protein [Deltaproteobacteria bacterium]